MNPSNVFGGQQFPGPNNSSGGPTSNPGFGQGPTFGQFSNFRQPTNFAQASGQSSVFGQNFGQVPTFGQTTGTVQASFSPISQASAFGPTSSGQATHGFRTNAVSAGHNQTSAFGQVQGFGPSSLFGQPNPVMQPMSSFGIAPNNLQPNPSSFNTGGSQPGFVQPTFGQPSLFGSVNPGQGNAQNVGFGPKSSFEPMTENVFKPISSVSPVPPSSQQPAPAVGVFGITKPVTGGSDTSGSTTSSLFSSVKPAAVLFNFSQPAASSFAAVTTSQTEITVANTPQFTFSQPVTTSRSSNVTNAPNTISVLNSPSTFSFSPKPESKMSFSGPSAFGQPSAAFKDSKPAVNIEVKSREEENSGSSLFGVLGKSMKRKEEAAAPNVGQEKSSKIEDFQDDGPRHPSKRTLMKGRGPTGGLFRSALSNVMKESVIATKRQVRSTERTQEDKPSLSGTQANMPITPPRPQAPIKHVLEKVENEMLTSEPKAEKITPVRRSRRSESTDSLGGLSPTDITAIHCKGIPSKQNKKDLVRKHFERFGQITKLYCRPEKMLTIVHYKDHASAAKAKKNGKMFNNIPVQIFWKRKRSGELTSRPSMDESIIEEQPKPESPQVTFQRKSLPRSPVVSTSNSLSKGSPVKKSSVAKILQFDREPQQDASSEGQSLDRPVINLLTSLQPLVGQIAENAEEKYRLLEQRDKILRQLRPKRTDLDMSKVFVGTCPDMCPEKERYMRETRNQLSDYELVPDTEKVDHYAAIKEYSRSSADQEEPLPHELRPLPVLNMTMDYLVTQIMDMGESNYREWYDFVWNRTRGIRKDITQQHLCDPLTVSLIEKCTRFHIHCSHHLCQEPMMTFDAKINNENMTKCLQSLKEMYQDLATKEVYCSSEPEFRQYSVLLKLNDGDILREVQQFRKEVRDSAEVKFAVQAFAAVNSNNFVRFFKLVKAASYLAGCILHRYFNQIRHAALKTLNTAYTVSLQRSTIFPVEDFVRMLMFRSATEATDFLQLHGLNVTDGVVELSRMAYQEPDLPLPQKKSVAIEKKKTVLIGEVVNGGPLPNPPDHTPVCSFDSNNKYIGDAACMEQSPAVSKVAVFQRQEVRPLVEIESRPQPKIKSLVEQKLPIEPPAPMEPPKKAPEPEKTVQNILPVPAVNTPLMFKPIFQPQVNRPPSPKKVPSYPEQDLIAEMESIVKDVVEAEVSKIAGNGIEYVSTALRVSESELQVVIGEVLTEMLKELCASEFKAEKERIAEIKRKQELEDFLNKMSLELCTTINEEVVTQCTQEIAAAEIKFALEEKAALLARCTDEVCRSLIEETLQVELGQLAKQVLDTEIQLIQKFIKRWRDVVTVRRQLKRQMRGFPAAPCFVDPCFKVKALVPSAPTFQSKDTIARGFINFGTTGNMVVSCTRLLKTRNDILHQMRVNYYYNLLLSKHMWTPLDLPTLVTESTPNPPERIFWKATLLLPSYQDDVNSIFTKWLEVKLGGEEMMTSMAEEGIQETLVLSNSLRNFGAKTHKVHLCIKVSHGPLSEKGQIQLEEQNQLLGTSALLMLLPPYYDTEDNEYDLHLLSALLQLKQVQQASGWQTPLPLALLIPSLLEEPISDHKLEKDLKLKKLVEDGLISEYILIHVSGTVTDLQASKQVEEAVRWLVSRSPASSALSSQPLLQFVEGGLCHEFYRRFHHDKQERAAAALQCQEPAAIIQLFNSVLVYLADVVSSERLASVSWPPPEFSLPENRELVPHVTWNDPQHLAWLESAILSLQLPDWDLPSQNAPWSSLCTSIFQYVSQIPSSFQSQPLLMSRLENLLARVRVQHSRQQDYEDQEWGDSNAGPSFTNIPWDDIIILCIEHRLKDWHVQSSSVARGDLAEQGEVLVYFFKDQLTCFLPPQSWIAAVKQTHKEKQQNIDGSKINSSRTLTPPTRSPRQKLFQSHIEMNESPSVLDITHTPTPQELLPHRLLSSIQQEKVQSQKFEEQLQRWLAMDSLQSVSLPLFMPSTLLSVPEILLSERRNILPAVHPTKGITASDTSGVSTAHRKSESMSLTQRMEELDRLILVNHEEELACSLKLNSLFEMVED